MKVGLVGIGEIARKQHVPAIAADPTVTLWAAASREGTVDGVPNYPSLTAMLEGSPQVEAVALCVPPTARFALAREALSARRHVLLEKPPGVTLAEVTALAAQAAKARLTLYATWHSRHAPGVEPLRQHLSRTTVRRVTVTWAEDVRVFHPGQGWIWQPGGFGVFDPGINALSILTHAIPRRFRLIRSKLMVPENASQPIRAELAFRDSADVPIDCTFDFDAEGPPTWQIAVETDAGHFALDGGGTKLSRNGSVIVDEPEREYRALYKRFSHLVAARESDVDLAPLAHVADAYMLAETQTVAAFLEKR